MADCPAALPSTWPPTPRPARFDDWRHANYTLAPHTDAPIV